MVLGGSDRGAVSSSGLGRSLKQLDRNITMSRI